MATKNNYYVYAYLDPRKKGVFLYGKYKFEYEPFYIGKGRNKRYKDHLKSSELTKTNNKNKHKQNKIKKIIKLGFEPIIIKIFQNLSEKKALYFEEKIIRKIGRNNLKTGPLTNLTDGGEGVGARLITDTFRKKQSDIMKKYYDKNPIPKEVADKISKILLSKNMVRSKETREKIGKANRGRVIGKQGRKNMSISKQKEKLLGRPYRKNLYILISPKGKKFEFSGRIELEKFILKSDFSVRILKFYNKGKINKKDVRNLKKETKNIKTNNFIGWEIKKISYKKLK